MKATVTVLVFLIAALCDAHEPVSTEEAHRMFNVKLGSAPVDTEGLPIVPLWTRNAALPASTPLHARVSYGALT
jgi:hypothetical protein